jgi:hypothetical protein
LLAVLSCQFAITTTSVFAETETRGGGGDKAKDNGGGDDPEFQAIR